MMKILQAINDEKLFRPFLGNELRSWQNWSTALRCLYGLLVLGQNSRAVVAECTGRDVDQLPEDGFDTALFLTGRRSGKSRIAAIIGAFEAVLAGHEKKLSKGEKGVVPIMAPTKWQARIVTNYVRSIFAAPMLRQEVVAETKEGFELRNGTLIQILAGDWRTVRGFTLLAAIVDEAAFFGYEEETKIRSDTELIRAVKPGLATVGGKLICISSPYARKGWCYSTYKKHFANNAGKTLVWNCPSRTMNPSLLQCVIDEAMAEDRAAALAEYMGEFRDDVAEFLPRGIVEQFVVKGRIEISPQPGNRYAAFADLSGGRSDDAALAIGHRDNRKAVIDKLVRYRPPFNPHEVIGRMADELRRYQLRRVVGDNYAADFVSRTFEEHGIRYTKADKPKNVLYGELLPRLCSGEIILLDNTMLIDQLAALERRTRSGGRDIIDHPQGEHDDLANAVAGCAEVLSTKVFIVGAL